MAFTDRTEAGRKLADALAGYRTRNPVVLALPRGGVPVAAEIADALEAPLDLVMVRKIGAPGQQELAMGAVVDGPDPLVVRNEEVIKGLGVDEAAFAAACRRELAEIERRRHHLIGERSPAEVSERTAIVVDDGIATGATTRAALRAARKRGPAWLVLAVPVAPTSTLAELAGEADDIVCLEDHELFGAIGMFYSDFRQLSDRDVIDIMARFSPAE
jgi:putative phosphoribosyl transferase